MSVKNGFSSTLNRFWGKKNKGHQLSKSTTNLSISTHIDAVPLSSHLEQNRITPLPVATSNAPFEQTFRITVLLPKGQLYVARLGAKTKLDKLLELVCENKQLDPEKYEFRHPIDTSQVFSFELTIGAVGLSEIRLCHKSEAYDNFNADEIIKLRHTGRDSLSSSEFSSRNSKHTLKTASPYSSTNSLNSIDSTGMSTNYRGPVLSLPPQPPGLLHRTTSGGHHPPVAPARKKRVAPRPPSQNSIPEREIIITTNGLKTLHPEFSQPKKDFHVSSPNLSQCTTELTTLRSADFHQSNLSIDCNGNNSSSRNNNGKLNDVDRPNGHVHCNGQDTTTVQHQNTQKTRPASMYVVGSSDVNYNNCAVENDLGSHTSSNGSIPGYAGSGSTETVKMPEPVPRKRITTAKKKAPAPPPRNVLIPVAPPRITTTPSPEKQTTEAKEVAEEPTTNGDIVKSSMNGIHKRDECKPDTSLEVNLKAKELEKTTNSEKIDPEKILENSKATNVPITSQPLHETTKPSDVTSNHTPDIMASSPQLAVSCESSALDKPKLEPKRSIESSSDEEEQIKVYNLKLGKTIVKPLVEHKNTKDFSEASTINVGTRRPAEDDVVESISSRSVSPGWTYTIPAPPNFADLPVSTVATKNDTIILEDHASEPLEFAPSKTEEVITPPDSPITPIIKERPPPVDFQVFSEPITPIANDTDSLETSETIITSDIEDGYRVGVAKVELKAASKEDQKNIIIAETPVQQKFEIKREDIIEKPPSPPNSLESYESTKSDVISELNDVISEQKIDTVIRKVEDTEEIESVKPCVLSNFKIQAYSQPSGPVKTLDQKQTEPQEVKVVNGELGRDTIEPTPPSKIEERPFLINQNHFLDEDKLYKKRPSLTLTNSITAQLFKSRGSITRSDSFHSTRYPNSMEPDEPLTSRSSSFLSLINAQKMDHRTNMNGTFSDTNRRKSSSELSIGESPSLQSLIVMKSILNSRKNSLNNENDLQKPKIVSSQNVYINQNSTESNSPAEVETFYDCDSSKENSPKNKILSQQVTSVERLQKNDEPEKKWRYQGPPSINVSTWNERPKIQVSIKDDSDYKSGVGCCNPGNAATGTNAFNCSNVARNYRSSLPNNSTIVEITSGGNKSPNQVRMVNEQPKIPFVRSVEYKKCTSVVQLENNDVNRPSNETNSPPSALRPLSVGNTMTLGRMPKINRTNFVPTVKGFKSIDHVEELPKIRRDLNVMQQQNSPEVVNVTTTWKPTSNHVQRSNSKVSPQVERNTLQVERNILKLSNQNNVQINNKLSSHDVNNENEKQENISPFQVTLRKTGLKEKIISSDEIDHARPPASQRNDLQNCAKLELKLTTVSPAARTTAVQSTIKQQQQQPCPPPPPPPIIRSVVTKQNPGIVRTSTTTTITTDPRDQLLSAIRGFKKDSLKRA